MLLGDGYPELKRVRLGKRGFRQFTPGFADRGTHCSCNDSRLFQGPVE
jgi:hypothetical protein